MAAARTATAGGAHATPCRGGSMKRAARRRRHRATRTRSELLRRPCDQSTARRRSANPGSVPLPGEQDARSIRFLLGGWHDSEDAAGARRAGVAGTGVLPTEGGAGEALEPRLLLWVRGRRGELQMEVRAGRVAGLADEAYLGARREHRACGDGRVEIGQVAVRPALP